MRQSVSAAAMKRSDGSVWPTKNRGLRSVPAEHRRRQDWQSHRGDRGAGRGRPAEGSSARKITAANIGDFGHARGSARASSRPLGRDLRRPVYSARRIAARDSVGPARGDRAMVERQYDRAQLHPSAVLPLSADEPCLLRLAESRARHPAATVEEPSPQPSRRRAASPSTHPCPSLNSASSSVYGSRLQPSTAGDPDGVSAGLGHWPRPVPDTRLLRTRARDAQPLRTPVQRAVLQRGFHVEHHQKPGSHWTRYGEADRADGQPSRWPPVLRWLEHGRAILTGLEQRAAGSLAFSASSSKRMSARSADCSRRSRHQARITIVGGRLFPRTALV